jgi:DNA repair exonuclease SbcCD ATPase subunit
MNNHIISLEVENVKRLTAVSLRPKAGLNIVGGKNGQGKSSLLDSIAMALGGKNEIPGEPLRRGTEKGSVTMTLSNGLTIKRGFTAKGTSLVVSNS